ncbi:hypothetical protein F442_12626 [Phytophthora nicotianae P10297]|uniref:BZIP domain-containing protein n=1 Tax=Phytophthora nicotianae P10297 TaxID=1317064 RepID=W2YXW5_PHYNI|nr:hypothetical protein F442_12626 [Phytophthora nicotianae P10297]
MTPISLPSLRLDSRFDPLSSLSKHAARLPQLPSAKTLSPERFDSLPTLSKRLCQRPVTLPQSRHSSASFSPEQPELAWRSTLTPDQAAALAIARRETGYMSSSVSNKLKDTWQGTPSSPATATEDWKKARRKEQCRINQANYRKRKRQYEQKVTGEIRALEQNIEQLETHRAAVANKGRLNPIQSVGDFYYAVGVDGNEQRLDLQNFRLADGSSPALQCLLDLQREEFDSVESLKLHWLWYREQFRIFQLSIASCERLEAGEHVIIKIAGQLQLDVYYDAQRQRGQESQGYGVITCPIIQQFEFETGEQVTTRITSEVDLVAGVTAAQDQSAPDCILSVLRCLSEGFSMSNRYQSI